MIHAPAALALFEGPGHVIVKVSAVFAASCPFDPIGKPAREVFIEPWMAPAQRAMDHVYATGATVEVRRGDVVILTALACLDRRACKVQYPGMLSDAPLTVPGPRLRAQREGYGITRKALAEKLQHHRNTLLAWESDPEVDVRRQRLYLAALRELVDAA